MKAIEFNNPACRRVYDNYINRCRRVVRILSAEDQEECVMEVNSYIYEYLQHHHGEDEMTALLNILERLGDPEITLKEVVAHKKIDQAVRTFNLKHLLQALFLNLRNGVAYIILFVLTIALLTFPVVIVAKILYPDRTGLWTGDGGFRLGWVDSQSGAHEVLGNLFIPVVLAAGILLYFVIVFILKAVRRKKPHH